MRNQIKSISSVFHMNKELNNSVKNYSPTQDVNGLTIIKDIQGTTDIIKHRLNSQITNKSMFINESYVTLLNSIFKIINKLTIRRFLEYMCDSAKAQNEMENLKEVIIKKDFIFYNSISVLSYEVIKTIYLHCFDNNIDIKKKLSLLQTTKQLFVSSRLQNEKIWNIKKSCGIHIKDSRISNKQTIISTLTSIYAMYLILKSFEYIS